VSIAVLEESESPQNTRTNRLSLNDDPSFCATTYDDQHFLRFLYAVQTTTPSGLRTSGNGW